VKLEDDKEEAPSGPTDNEEQEIEELEKKVLAINTMGLSKLEPADFEKDDDTNHHIDWITSASNVRAWNYTLPQSTRQKCRMTAGRIIPAIATTTASITGFIFLEMYKLIKGETNIDAYRWNSINLANNATVVEKVPDPIRKRSGKQEIMVEEKKNKISKKIITAVAIPNKHTCYDFINIKGRADTTIADFVKDFPKIFKGCVPTMLLAAASKKGGFIWDDSMGKKPNTRGEQMQIKVRTMKLKKFKAAGDEAGAATVQALIEESKAKIEQRTKKAEMEKSIINGKLVDRYYAIYGPNYDPNQTFILLDAAVTHPDHAGVDAVLIPKIRFYIK